ncbi:MAG: AAA family ATPase [Proteobacteria bacterium]|nr:AAA family ATPase [Pseudomonadota bacterium]
MIPKAKDTPVPAQADKRSDPDQGQVLRGLLDPQCYPHEVAAVERIETHISTVLLAGAYAYKIKKPVDMGFLDFSTLALRHHYCEEELRLNRRLAPGLYLDVVAIVGGAAAPRIVAMDDPLAADAIEFAVKMRRFDQSALLDHMLDRGELTPHHIDALAETVAGFHARIARAGDVDHGTPERIALPMRQNFSQIRPLLSAAGEIAELDALESWSIARHNELAPVMAARHSAGDVRECHGDLHLGNITWIDGEIHVFDCIEFNPELRWIDVVNEVAFTVMDLAARGRPDWGARFLNAYLEITGDYASLRLLPYYLVYRAMVRAKVARIRAAQTGGEAQRAALADYAGHIRLARSYTLPRQAALIITHGVSGSGKSTATLPLVEQLGALRLRSDVERKRLHGLARDARTGTPLGTGLYSDAASMDTYVELGSLAVRTIEAGYPVIVDATFLNAARRMAFRAIAADLKVAYLILDFVADAAELRRRVSQRQAQGKDASEATLAVLERQLRNDEPLDAGESDYAIVIDTQADTPADILARVRVRLARGAV